MTSAYDPDPPGAAPLKVLFIAGALIWGVLTLAPELGTIVPRTPEQDAVAVSVERALVASQSAAVPRVRDSTGGVGPHELAAMHARIREIADELLTGAYRDSWTRTMDQVIDREGAESLVFGGGADHFSRWHIEIAGSEATVQVRARAFLEYAQTLLGSRSIAENIIDLDLRLVLTDGSWLVAAWAQEFAPGGGP